MTLYIQMGREDKTNYGFIIHRTARATAYTTGPFVAKQRKGGVVPYNRGLFTLASDIAFAALSGSLRAILHDIGNG